VGGRFDDGKDADVLSQTAFRRAIRAGTGGGNNKTRHRTGLVSGLRVIPRELRQGTDHGFGAGHRLRETVGLIFGTARQKARERRKQV